MFEKLLSVLPYNPSIIDKFYFYSKRIKSEKSVRRMTLVIIVIGFLVQFFAVFSPPTPTLADSPNDLINGGFSSASQAASDCSNNIQDYGSILAYYGITCSMVANASTVTINSDASNHQLYSMGRLPYSIAGESTVNIPGISTPFYVRFLWGWDRPGTTSYYQALQINTAKQTFYLLYPCGNLTSIGLPVPNPPPAPQPQPTCPAGTTGTYPNCVKPIKPTCPAGTTGTYPNCVKPLPLPYCQTLVSTENPYACIQTSKSAQNVTESINNANNTEAQPGDVIEYTLNAKNVGDQTINNYVFQDNLSYVLDYSSIINLDGGTLKNNNEIVWPPVNIGGNQTVSKQFEVRVDNPIPSTPTSTSDPNYFNLVMSNTFGNTININLPSPPAKTIETVTTTSLPNTGPGSSLVVVGIIAVFAGFFFYRSRILVKETDIIIKETVPIGE